MTEKNVKPLGRKCYGSIGHLPCSRLGPGDHKLPEGQGDILTAKTRDRHDFIIVQEKLDGSNVGVAKLNGEILALGRSGYLAQTSRFEQHQLFAAWASANERRFKELLQDGERLCGEWLAQAHGTRYQLLHEPFVAFDIMRGEERAILDECITRLEGRFVTPHLIHAGFSPCSVDVAMSKLTPLGFHGAMDPVEGAVWRCERKGKVDFLGKYVRPDKADGCYLPELTGTEAVWNWTPTKE